VKKYKEKLKEVEAQCFDGDQQALMDVVSWIQENGYVWYDMFTPAPACGVTMDPSTGFLILVNRQGELARVQKSDWVVKQPNGNLAKMTNEEFEATYEEVKPAPTSTTFEAPIEQLPDTPIVGETPDSTPAAI
jgi:hypothetical protein